MEHLAPVVTFRPTKNGEVRGALVLTARWPDGRTETQRIELIGAGRAIDDVPHAQLTDDERAAQVQESQAQWRFESQQDAAAEREKHPKTPQPGPCSLVTISDGLTCFIGEQSGANDLIWFAMASV